MYAAVFLTASLLFVSCGKKNDILPEQEEKLPVGEVQAEEMQAEEALSADQVTEQTEESPSTDQAEEQTKEVQNPKQSTETLQETEKDAEPDTANNRDSSQIPEAAQTTASSPLPIRYDTLPLLDSKAASPDAHFEIYYLDGVPDNVKDLIEDRVSLIPEVILENLAQNGFRYIVDPTGVHSFSHAGTCTYPNCFVDGQFLALPENINPPFGEIAINGSSMKKAEMSSIHEVGHAVDFMLGYADRTYTTFQNNTYLSLEGDPEWKEIFEEEAALSGFPDYNRTVPLEYFAEVFRFVFEDPAKLKNIPRSKEYVETKLAEFYGITFD